MDFELDHERLEVYQVGRELNREIRELLAGLPAGSHESRDNLLRGAKSITRNIAEGSGRWGVPDRIHFYNMARGSATECAASLDELLDFGLATDKQIEKSKALTWRIVSMLVALMRSLQNTSAAHAPRPRPPRPPLSRSRPSSKPDD